MKAREQEAVKQIKEATEPGKLQRLKAGLVSQLPYHKPKLAAGTSFTAELRDPLQLGQ